MFNFDLDFDIDITKAIELDKLLEKIEIIKKNNEIQQKIDQYTNNANKIDELEKEVEEGTKELMSNPEYVELNTLIESTKKSSRHGTKNIENEYNTLLDGINTKKDLIKMNKDMETLKADPLYKLNSLKPIELKNKEEELQIIKKNKEEIPSLEQELLGLQQQKEKEDKKQSKSSSTTSSSASTSLEQEQNVNVGGTKHNRKSHKQLITKKYRKKGNKLTKKYKKIRIHKITKRNKN